MRMEDQDWGQRQLQLVSQGISNTLLSILNTLTHISTYFFTHMYIKNTQTILFKLLYQTRPQYLQLGFLEFFQYNICIQVEFKSSMHNTCTRLEPTTGWVSKTQTRPICFTGRVKYPRGGQFSPSLLFFLFYILYARQNFCSNLI